MHELHLIRDLLEDVLRVGKIQSAKKITKIYIKMGKFSEIDPDVLKHNFAEISKGTIAEGAAVDIKPSKARELRLVSFDCEASPPVPLSAKQRGGTMRVLPLHDNGEGVRG